MEEERWSVGITEVRKCWINGIMEWQEHGILE